MRTFKFKLLTQAQLEEFSTNATTLGEMKSEIRNNPDLLRKFGVNSNSNLDEVQFIERSSKTTYSLDSAILPTTDATLFVSVIKSKAGVELDEMRKYYGVIDDKSRYSLELFAKRLNDENEADIDLDGSRSNLYEEILEFIEEEVEHHEAVLAAAQTPERNLDELIEQGYKLVKVLLDFLAEAEDFDAETRSELQKEAQRIQSYFDRFRYVG
ncbi:MAG: hypothetical protein RBT05_05255 [Bacteroidales bacterium]|jgi:hypothetical protein|nr:hypothetical protein [Bacteroidales bacterium]